MTKRILLVEDDIDVAEVTREVLLEEGYEVSYVNNGLEALQFLKEQEPPDLILLDLMMPQMSGTQFLHEFVKLPLYRKLPILLVSAGRDVETIATQLGVQGFLVKPFDVDALLAAVSRYL